MTIGGDQLSLASSLTPAVVCGTQASVLEFGDIEHRKRLRSNAGVASERANAFTRRSRSGALRGLDQREKRTVRVGARSLRTSRGAVDGVGRDFAKCAHHRAVPLTSTPER
jgi:hypothetical protein